MLKSLFLLSVIAVAGTAFAEAPVAKVTPNGGVEYYSNHYNNQGTVEHGCIIPWRYAGKVTMGYNPKRIEVGDITRFVDCNIPKPAPVAAPVAYVERTVTVTEPAAPVAPTPAPAPVAPAPTQNKHVKE